MSALASSLPSAMPRSSAASRYQVERQLRQKPARSIRSIFWTSVRSRKCSTNRRKAAASSSVLVFSSITASFRAAWACVGAVVLDLVQAGLRAQHLRDDAGKVVRPFPLPFGVEDQVLAHLDQRMRKPTQGGVAVERIAVELSRIWNVVADLDVGNGPQALEQGQRQARVRVPQHRHTPWPRLTLPSLRETMDREDHRRLAGGDGPFDGAIDGRVVRPVELVLSLIHISEPTRR